MKALSLVRMRYTHIFFIFGWVLCAQKVAAQPLPLQFDHVLELGAPGSQVCLQDRDGFLWFGTEGGGLFHYDGYELKHYGVEPGGLPNGTIWRVIEDAGDPDIFWIGTNDGLVRFNRVTEAMTVYTHDPHNPESLGDNSVLDIVQDRSDPSILWLGTHVSGLNKFHTGSGRVTRYEHDPANPESVNFPEVWRLLEDPQDSNILWVGTFGGGLDRFDKTTETFSHFVHDPENPSSIGASDGIISFLASDLDDPHILWIGTDNGLDALHTPSEQFTHYVHDTSNPQSIPEGSVSFIHDDGEGRLWLGAYVENTGLTLFDKSAQTFTNYRHQPEAPDSLSDDLVVNVYPDRSGIFWIITYPGLVDAIDPHVPKIKLYQHNPLLPSSLSHNTVTFLYEDHQGTVWVGTQNGLNRFNAAAQRFHRYQHRPDDVDSLKQNYILGIYADSARRLWVSLYFGPLSMVDSSTGRVRREYTAEGVESFTCIIGDPDNPDILWLGSRNGGLVKFNIPTEEFLVYRPNTEQPDMGPSHQYIYKMLHDPYESVLWFGSPLGGGLNRFDKTTQRFRHYSNDPENPDSPASDTIADVYQEASGIIWLGTLGGGLDRFDPQTETFTHYDDRLGLPADIYGILGDRQKRLWLSTNTGIFCLDPETGQIDHHYTGDDGLQGAAFFPASALKTHDGRLWFGGTNGLNAFEPENLPHNSYIPPVVLTSVTQGGEQLIDKTKTAPFRMKELVLDWKRNFFEFQYAALNFTIPRKNRYRYMLEGFDRHWYEAGTTRIGRYSGLPGGTYTLRILGSNNDGVWNEEGASLRVTVIPPFWQTWWFSTILIMAILGSLAGGAAWRVHTIETRRKELEDQVRERTKELEETKESALEARRLADAANRSKSLFLANMSHELRTPLNAVLGFSQILSRSPRLTPNEAEDVHIILRNGSHLLNLINQLLDISKIEAGRMTVHERNVDVFLLLDEAERMFRLLASEKRLQFLFERDVEVPQFIRTDEVKLRQVLFNLVNNALKFTTEGGVAVRIRISDCELGIANLEDPKSEIQNLQFEIEDTGPGIAPEDVERIFEAFEQTETGYRANEGTGLGLPLSRNFVRLMGGDLTLKSQVGIGSLFSFFLPVTVLQAQDLYESMPVRHVVGIAAGQPRYRILVVDDKHENRRLLVKLLEPLGFHVREAQHGQEAIDIWDAWEPHLIWMDMRMPVLDGYKATERIKATTKGQATAIVALTASAFEEEKAVVLSAGCDDFLRKPFKESEIFDMLHKHLGVEFVYEENTPSTPESEDSRREEESLRQAVAALPTHLYEKLCRAVEAAELQNTLQAIDRIRSQNALLADALNDLLKGYRFDILQTLIAKQE